MHDAAVKVKAEEMFIINGFSMETIQTMLPEVSRKSLYNWRKEDEWERKRRERSVRTAGRRERLEALVDRLLDELDVTLDPKLIFSMGKIIAALKSSSTFDFTDEKKEKDDSKKKGLSPETLREIEEKLLDL